jgi:hypothetical protein
MGNFGNRFFEQLQPLAAYYSSLERVIRPVTLPPGLARLSTRPIITRQDRRKDPS